MVKFIIMTTNKSEERTKNVEIITSKLSNYEISINDNLNLMDHFIKICLENTNFVLLQDDIKLCENFEKEINKAISNNKDFDIISFFDLKQNEKSKNHCMNQCVFIKDARNINKFKQEYLKKNINDLTADDLLLDYYIKQNKLNYLIFRPNLVQHLPFKSLFKYRSTKRQSKNFKDEII